MAHVYITYIYHIHIYITFLYFDQFNLIQLRSYQRKNELYIRTIRKLEVEKERFISDSNSNSNSKFNEDLLSYAKELESLREYRQQTEEIVQAIVQERDAEYFEG